MLRIRQIRLVHALFVVLFLLHTVGASAITQTELRAVRNNRVWYIDKCAGSTKEVAATDSSGEARTVVASFYGTNSDSDKGSIAPLKDTWSYAELSTNPGEKDLDFAALGKLPDHHKLAITFNNKTVVAEKLDVGGGERGENRAIDLYKTVADALGFTSTGIGDVVIKDVPDDTPLGPNDQLGSTTPTNSTTTNLSNCRCETSASKENTSTPESSSPNDKLKNFVDKYIDGAYNSSIKSGVPYDFTLAQAIIESGYGESGLTVKANNFFGIKAGSAWTGSTITMSTKEYRDDGSSYMTTATFRSYATPEEGFADHDMFFYKNKRYHPAFRIMGDPTIKPYKTDPYQFLAKIREAGYATDPGYVNTVSGVIKSVQEYIKTKNSEASSGLAPQEVKFAKTYLPSTAVNYEIDESFLSILRGESTGEQKPSSGSNATTSMSCDTGGGLDGVECPLEEGQFEKVNVNDTTYYKLPDAPSGEYTIYASDKRRYGHKQLVCAIYSVAKAYKAKYDGKSQVSVGDLTAAGHKSHFWGIAVDIDAPDINPGDGIDAYAADHTKGHYSTEATVDFGKLWIDTGLVKNIWWCPPGGDTSIQQITDYAKTKGTPLNAMHCITGHNNHFHVDINTPKGAYYAP
jgi:flagellum-specific peptidoglycan hydrolase FlgJ